MIFGVVCCPMGLCASAVVPHSLFTRLMITFMRVMQRCHIASFSPPFCLIMCLLIISIRFGSSFSFGNRRSFWRLPMLPSTLALRESSSVVKYCTSRRPANASIECLPSLNNWSIFSWLNGWAFCSYCCKFQISLMKWYNIFRKKKFAYF